MKLHGIHKCRELFKKKKKKIITYTEFAVPKVILESVTNPGFREGTSCHARRVLLDYERLTRALGFVNKDVNLSLNSETRSIRPECGLRRTLRRQRFLT